MSDGKGSILPNNFKTESKPPENDPKKAHHSPESDEENAQNAPSGALVGESGARPAPGPAPAAAPVVGAHGHAPASNPTKKRGPRTKAGKRAVSRNAIKHGILSPHPVVIAGLETIEDWEEFESKIVEDWQTAGPYERELASDIAFGLWRLRRCRIHESAQISRQVEEVEGELQHEDDEDDDDEAIEERELPPVDPVRLRAHQHLNVIPDGWSIDRILRYETHVRRALLQTVHELEVRQAHRRGEQMPLARVDFTAGPSLRRPSVAGSSALQQINQDMALAERGLGERKRAARAEKAAHV